MTVFNQRIRQILTGVMIPVLISSLVAIAVVNYKGEKELGNQLDRYGKASAQQLAVTLTEYLINDDLLSLNVLLSEFVQQQHFDSASVYDADRRLLAQTGTVQRHEDARSYGAEISFQKEVTGYVEIGVSTASIQDSVNKSIFYILLFNGFLAGLLILIHINSQSFSAFLRKLILFLNKSDEEAKDDADKYSSAMSHTRFAQSEDAAILLIIVKTKNTYRHESLMQLIHQSTGLYGGRIVGLTPGEYCMAVDGSNRIKDVMCFAWLIKTLCEKKFPSMEIKTGIHLIEDGDFTNARKHTSYIASIASKGILISEAAFKSLNEPSDFDLKTYQDSTVSENQVFSLVGLSDEATSLVERQAMNIITHL